jgi:hypothetical protein
MAGQSGPSVTSVTFHEWMRPRALPTKTVWLSYF